MKQLYTVKPELAFKAIKGKQDYIRNSIPDTEDGVVVVANDPSDRDLGYSGFKYRLRDLDLVI